MKQVKCISPHGGCHNGMNHHGQPVYRLPNGDLPDIDPATLRLPPNEGGYVHDGRIPGGHAAVGKVYEVGDDFVADGFHWEDVETPQPEPAPAPSTGAEG